MRQKRLIMIILIFTLFSCIHLFGESGRTFYISCTNYGGSGSQGVFYATAENPAEPWSEPVMMGKAPAKELSTEKNSGFTGVFIGMYVSGNG